MRFAKTAPRRCFGVEQLRAALNHSRVQDLETVELLSATFKAAISSWRFGGQGHIARPTANNVGLAKASGFRAASVGSVLKTRDNALAVVFQLRKNESVVGYLGDVSLTETNAHLVGKFSNAVDLDKLHTATASTSTTVHYLTPEFYRHLFHTASLTQPSIFSLPSPVPPYLRRPFDSPFFWGSIVVDILRPMRLGCRVFVQSSDDVGNVDLLSPLLSGQHNVHRAFTVWLSLGSETSFSRLCQAVECQGATNVMILRCPNESGFVARYLAPFAASHVVNALRNKGHNVVFVTDSLKGHVTACHALEREFRPQMTEPLLPVSAQWLWTAIQSLGDSTACRGRISTVLAGESTLDCLLPDEKRVLKELQFSLGSSADLTIQLRDGRTLVEGPFHKIGKATNVTTLASNDLNTVWQDLKNRHNFELNLFGDRGLSRPPNMQRHTRRDDFLYSLATIQLPGEHYSLPESLIISRAVVLMSQTQLDESTNADIRQFRRWIIDGVKRGFPDVWKKTELSTLEDVPDDPHCVIKLMDGCVRSLLDEHRVSKPR